jgi:hypothetical protein
MPARVAAQRLGISSSLIHVWVRHGVLMHDQHRAASRVWVRLTDKDRARLDGSCTAMAARLPTFDEVMRSEQLSREALWDKVRRGAYRAFRVARGRCWEWRLQKGAATAKRPSAAADVQRDPGRTHHHE